tara:strand:- start:2817 stop:4139 length:1323 start_codon:yes stop_codon:yes gene_type:complete
MWTYYPELLERAVPRYTSYPTAVDFSSAVGMVEMASALAKVQPEEDISLYLHVPYCHEICWYCGCNTGAAGKAHRLAAYVEALESEIALVAQHLGGRGKIRRIAWGGGSPNALPPVDFVRLLDQIARCFGETDAEIAVEVDPRSLDQRWIDTLKATGVTRVSMGVQTFAPHVQAKIGRIQPFERISDSMAALRRAGMATVSFDLMYGLPGQSADDLAETLALAMQLGPDRIALFGYAHVPRLLPRQRRIDDSNLPDAAARFAMAALGHEQLTHGGYRAVGFDHFAKPHDALAMAAAEKRLGRNFQGFTDDASSVLIGLGASAISQFPSLIVQNEKNAGRYRMRLSAGQLPSERGVHARMQDSLQRQIIFDLLCHGEARLLAARLTPHETALLDDFARRDLLTYDADRILLAADATPYRRTIAAIFDGRLEPSQARFSNAI